MALQMHNDVSFFVRSARELRRVGSLALGLVLAAALAGAAWAWQLPP